MTLTAARALGTTTSGLNSTATSSMPRTKRGLGIVQVPMRQAAAHWRRGGVRPMLMGWPTKPRWYLWRGRGQAEPKEGIC